MTTYIISHANCFDGTGAAWSAFKRYGHAVEYRFAQYQHNANFSFIRPGDEVFFLDVCFPRQTLIDLAKVAKRVVVIDHHKTAKEDLENLNVSNIEVNFDMKFSGAQLAWKYFNPGQPTPLLVNFIGDRDLWKFDLKQTKVIMAAVGNRPLTIESFNEIHEEIEKHGLSSLEVEGRAVLRFQEQLIKECLVNLQQYEWEGKMVGTVNFGPLLRSEMANTILQEYTHLDFALCWWEKNDGQIQHSVRARTSGRICDVEAIAKRFGGGGHLAAAAFSSKKREI